MIVHPGSNVGAVIGFGSVLVGGLDFNDIPSPSTDVSSISNNPTISPTDAELDGP